MEKRVREKKEMKEMKLKKQKKYRQETFTTWHWLIITMGERKTAPQKGKEENHLCALVRRRATRRQLKSDSWCEQELRAFGSSSSSSSNQNSSGSLPNHAKQKKMERGVQELSVREYLSLGVVNWVNRISAVKSD